MTRVLIRLAAASAAAALTVPALAGVIVTQQAAPAPTYGTTLNFDEPGTPTGPVSQTQWQGSKGITLAGGAGDQYVDNWAVVLGYPWLGTGQSWYAPWGTFMTFDSDLTSFSCQAWDTSGPGGPFGGGMVVVALNDGVEVAIVGVNPTFSAVGPTWYNITTTGGSVFDEVRLVGNGFFPEGWVDNLSWNAVPEPSSLVLLALGAAAIGARRR